MHSHILLDHTDGVFTVVNCPVLELKPKYVQRWTWTSSSTVPEKHWPDALPHAISNCCGPQWELNLTLTTQLQPRLLTNLRSPKSTVQKKTQTRIITSLGVQMCFGKF